MTKIGAITKKINDNLGLMMTDMTTLWTSLQEAIVKIQAINLQNKLKLGGYTLWVDASGKLRIFEGTPTSDTAGVVVGTQTA